uniref:Uncharacterized protein n=1 Tax=Anopheles albimanus TaxID=7167 RepID=A0A182FX94_ANOAL
MEVLVEILSFTLFIPVVRTLLLLLFYFLSPTPFLNFVCSLFFSFFASLNLL